MGRPKGNHQNIQKVKQWLEKNDIEYFQLNEYHFRIIGPTSLVDLWPSRMTYHIVESERAARSKYSRLSYNFNPAELEKIL